MPSRSTTSKPRVGFVLGGGGMLGGAWLAGALGALHEATGLGPGDADLVIGTSAGSAIGALATSGIAPEYLSAYACGRSLEGLAAPNDLPEDEATALRDSAVAFTLEKAVPFLGPGSLRMALGTLRNPLRHPPTALMAGWIPQGAVSTRPLREAIGAVVPDWPEDHRFWAVACDYKTGKRVPLGSSSGPEARLQDAVGASCAIPGFYRPVEIGDRCYVDGGVCSASNLDLVLRAPQPLDLVVCLNPMSSADAIPDRSPAGLLGSAMRASIGRRLGHEAAKVRRTGTQVVLLQPGADEVRAMGLNMMRKSGREELAELAARNVQRALRQTGVRKALRSAASPAPRPAPRDVQAVTRYVDAA